MISYDHTARFWVAKFEKEFGWALNELGLEVTREWTYENVQEAKFSSQVVDVDLGCIVLPDGKGRYSIESHDRGFCGLPFEMIPAGLLGLNPNEDWRDFFPPA